LFYNVFKMLLQASQIKGLPVGSTDTQERVGTVSDIIIDPDSGGLLGFVVKSGLLGSNKVLSFHDVTGIDHSVILVKEPESVLPVAEVAPIKHALADRRKLLKGKVVTEGGTNLGRVTDVVINTDTAMVTKLYISHVLEERIVSAEKIVKVTKDHIVVKDDVVLGRAAVGDVIPA
jgi:uncharacterized protein YrrD